MDRSPPGRVLREVDAVLDLWRASGDAPDHAEQVVLLRNALSMLEAEASGAAQSRAAAKLREAAGR